MKELIIQAAVINVCNQFCLFPLRHISQKFGVDHMLQLFFDLQIHRHVFLDRTGNVRQIGFTSIVKQTGKCRLWQIVSRSCLMAALDAVLTYRKKLWEMPVCPRHHRQGMCNILNSYFILFRLKGIKVNL